MPYTFIGNDTHGGFISPGPNVLSVGIFRAGLGLLWKAEMTFLQTHHHHIKKSWKSIPFNSNMGNRESYIPRDCLQWKISLKRIQSPWLVWLRCSGILSQSECCWFNFQSWHMPGLQVQSPVGALTEDNQSMFLSHILLSLYLSISLKSKIKITLITKWYCVKFPIPQLRLLLWNDKCEWKEYLFK